MVEAAPSSGCYDDDSGEYYYDDFPTQRVEDCGAPVVLVVVGGEEVGWRCDNGHSHFSMEFRAKAGFDYYDNDEIDAARRGLFTPSTRMVDMAGSEVF